MMDLFDPKYIWTKGDDSLIGKKVFFGDSLDELRVDVDSRTGVRRTLRGVADCAFIDDMDHTWEYIYYDPNYECKVAYSQGRQIQTRHSPTDEWSDTTNPQWYTDSEYRVAPEYRPYTSFDEFLIDVAERFPTTRNRPAGTMPLVWVKLQQNTSIFRLITGYVTNSGGTVFELSADIYTCKAMFEMFTYMDGTPFGKKE